MRVVVTIKAATAVIAMHPRAGSPRGDTLGQLESPVTGLIPFVGCAPA